MGVFWDITGNILLKKMEDRIRIINKFKSMIGERKKSINNRLFFLWLISLVNISIILFSIIIAIDSSNLGFNFGLDKKWADSSSIVMSGLAFIILTPHLLLEILLMNHLKNVSLKKEPDDNKVLNANFEKHINYLNQNNTSKVLMIVLTLIILFGALLSSDNKGDILYWGHFKIPFLILILFIISYVISNYKKLNRNIKTYEQ
uniref:hypothetical protein n=1 Tax=uncultured Christiangramia sp. TaxID=503836 RepID=UPI00261BB44B|nr:hypothetical protein [uncultured Christiangramia sp.]